MTNKKELQHYGGDGFGGLKEYGLYFVHYQEKKKPFNSLSKARAFYDSLNEEKAFWSHNNAPELIDAYS